MRKSLCLAASTAVLILGAKAADTPAPQHPAPATQAKAHAAPKPVVHSAKTAPAAKTATASKAGARTSTAAHRTSAAPVPKRPVTSWRNRQAAPTPDRYKEIQGALAAKGYLQPEAASGQWDQTSAEAMKKFQADQKLDSTGKVNSLSLIALGLGPKYEAPAPAKPAAPATPAGNSAPAVTTESR